MAFQGASYDVFLSFRGEDTRKNLTEHLAAILRQKGIRTFMDDKLRGGEEISTTLVNVINESRIAVLVISKNYASSTWCMDELTKILECRKTKEQIVVPLFYGVDPSDVRHQRKSFYEAFAKHETRFKDDTVQRWKAALNKVANLVGWHHKQEIETVFLNKVVEDIAFKRIPTNLKISIYPLRYDTCHEYLSLFLQVGSKDVLMVGICGPSRMGKTAIAKAIYKQIFFTFEGSSFLTGVGQNSKQPNGLVYLQEKFLSDILLEDIAITNVTRGMDMIKEKLCFKRVLIVLDDVDDLDQLYSLVGNRNWFGLGSKIIITTRNVYLLNVLGVDQILSAKGLPLPQNIEDIWEPFQQSNGTIAGLKEYIQTFSNLRNERMRYLQDCLLRERQKNAIQKQVILDLKQAQGLDYGQQVTMKQIND